MKNLVKIHTSLKKYNSIWANPMDLDVGFKDLLPEKNYNTSNCRGQKIKPFIANAVKKKIGSTTQSNSGTVYMLKGHLKW